MTVTSQSSRKRISYVIPPPPPGYPVPRFRLPPPGDPAFERERIRGKQGPLLVPLDREYDKQNKDVKDATPRHRLGVACLALDTCTILEGRNTPEGILYSGGRDGMVMSWDLGLDMRRRRVRGHTDFEEYRVRNGWEYITGWADELERDSDDEGDELVQAGSTPPALPSPSTPYASQHDKTTSDGDVLGDVTLPATMKRKRIRKALSSTPYEKMWEVNPDLDMVHKEGPPSTFRQCAHTHEDWVNDILLCNYNQTLVSASSDGTIKAWNPHSSPSSFSSLSSPTLIGLHSDYVRCITYSREQRWVASGSFDRTIKLWDLSQSQHSNTNKPTPLLTLTLPENHHASLSVCSPTSPAPLGTTSSPVNANANSKHSIYSLTTDPFGHVIASGSPERVVRLWDPRTTKRVGKLVGHTDNIRSILISSDGRYLLTGSADASIKLWSLVTQRCLHTFTHHAESVWALCPGDDERLGVFYSGDRSGNVCRVDVDKVACLSEGECVLVCRDLQETGGGGGINKIVSADDQFVWTASGSGSSIKRWRIPKSRSARAVYRASTTAPSMATPGSDDSRHGYDEMDDQEEKTIPATSLIRLVSPNDPFPFGSGLGLSPSPPRVTSLSGGVPGISLGTVTGGGPVYEGREVDVSTLYSAASFLSIPRALTTARMTPLNRGFLNANGRGGGSQRPQDAENQQLFNSRSFSSLRPPPHSPSYPPSQYHLDMHDHDGTHDLPILASEASPYSPRPDFVIQGDVGLVRALILNDRIHVLTIDAEGEVDVWDVVRGICVGRFVREGDHNTVKEGEAEQTGTALGDCVKSPRETLELVRELVEGHGVTSKWATVDTKSGLLVVHLNERCFEAEVYADEVGYPTEKEEVKINLGKWVLRNLFLGFLHEEQRLRKDQVENSATPSPTGAAFNLPPSKTHAQTQKRVPDPLSLSYSHPSFSASLVVCAPNMIPALLPSVEANPEPAIPLMTPLIPIQQPPEDEEDNVLTPISHSRNGSTSGNGNGNVKSSRPSIRSRATSGSASSINLGGGRPQVNITVPPLPSIPTEYYSPLVKTTMTPISPADDFSGWSGPVGKNNNVRPNASTNSGPGTGDGTREGSKEGKDGKEGMRPTTPTAGSGLIGRLKSLGGKINVNRKMTSSEAISSAPAISTTSGTVASTIVTTANRTDGETRKSSSTTNQKDPERSAAEHILSGSLTLPQPIDAPVVALPPNTLIMISEETSPHHLNLYRGTVGSTHTDVKILEEVMPSWLLAYLLQNKSIPQTQAAKISFVLLPWTNKDHPDEEALPELLNTAQSKLTASKYLRVRKLVNHVQEKLDKLKTSSGHPSPAPASIISSISDESNKSHAAKQRAEDVYEILCNEVLLPLDMTLAAVRQYVWKSSAELTMLYRLKKRQSNF